jgi:hypothetical protein
MNGITFSTSLEGEQGPKVPTGQPLISMDNKPSLTISLKGGLTESMLVWSDA